MQTEAGAVAFVTFYFEQVNKGLMAPDPDLISGLSDPECQGCVSLTDLARSLMNESHHYQSAAVSVHNVRPAPGARTTEQFIDFVLEQHDANVVDSNGAIVERVQASREDRRVLLEWRDARWLTRGIA